MSIHGLIVGLGNPGPEYTATRHNYGFIALDAVLEYFERHGRLDKLSSAKDPYILWRGSLHGSDQALGQWLFMKPLTYMNRSGQVVQPVCAYYKLAPESVIVLHDELDLPSGRIKWKRGGGNAGHNGLKSIQERLATPNFARLRLGIGKPAGFDSASYVLGRFSSEEMLVAAKVSEVVMEGLLLFMRKGEKFAEQYLNGYCYPPA